MKTRIHRLRLAALVTAMVMVATVTPANATPDLSGNTPSAEANSAAPASAETAFRLETIPVELQEQPGVKIAPSDPALGAPIENSPEWTVGLGRYIYVYLNPGDWNMITSVGYGAAAGAICFMLTSTGVGAALCGAIASAIYVIVLANSGPRSGYCAEIKFNYLGRYRGLKYLKRNC